MGSGMIRVPIPWRAKTRGVPLKKHA